MEPYLLKTPSGLSNVVEAMKQIESIGNSSAAFVLCHLRREVPVQEPHSHFIGGIVWLVDLLGRVHSTELSKYNSCALPLEQGKAKREWVFEHYYKFLKVEFPIKVPIRVEKRKKGERRKETRESISVWEFPKPFITEEKKKNYENNENRGNILFPAGKEQHLFLFELTLEGMVKYVIIV